jgi:hypothetical protein
MSDYTEKGKNNKKEKERIKKRKEEECEEVNVNRLGG